ncbi:MAG: hypothetical protein MK193_02680 [Lentisphaeria bacterium]|nr:hypothetical protein [Lentisphaeria bacterium]
MEYICKSFAVKYIVILLFAFHPMQVESVVWLMGRKDLLMTTFTFLSILCFLNNKMSQPALRYLLTSIFLTFALLCKPSVISIIPLFVIIECLRTKSIKKSSWTLILVFLGFAFYHIQQNNPYIFQGTGFKFYQAPYLTWHFISRFFLINSSEPMYLWYKRSASGVILGYILTLSIIGYILYSLKKKKWSENSMLFASTLFFVAPLHIYVISHRVFYTADRYYYTMLAPFSAFIVILLFKFKNKIIPVSISALFIVSNFFYTQKNVEYWKDSFTFWEHLLKENADSYFVNYRYARLLQRNGENELALKYFRKAHDISPTRSAPYIALINQLYLMEQFDEAMLKISQLEQYMPKNKELVRIKLSIYEDKYKKAKTHENYQQLYEYYLFLELTDKAEKLAKPSLTKEGQKDK